MKETGMVYEPAESEWDGVMRPRRCFLCGKACENTGPVCPECQARAVANFERWQTESQR